MPISKGPFNFPSQRYFDVSDDGPQYIPLPINVPSIDPALVLTELIKYRDRIGGPAITRFFLQDGPVNFRTLIGITESDDIAFSNLKYWVGVFSDAKMRIRDGCCMFVYRKNLPGILNWIVGLVNAVESFMQCYPGEYMRRVKWEERVAQGTGFSFHALRLKGRTLRSTLERLGAPDSDWEYQSLLILKIPKEDSDRGESDIEEPIEDWQTISDRMTAESQSTYDHEQDSDLDVGDAGDELSDDDDTTHVGPRDDDYVDSTESLGSAPSIKREPSIFSGNGDVSVNGIGVLGPRILETPAPQPTPSPPPKPRKRISRDWQRINIDTGNNEHTSGLEPNDNDCHNGTKIFQSITVGNSAPETILPPQGGETSGDDDDDDIEDAAFEVLGDGTVIYEYITLGVPPWQQVTPSASNTRLSNSEVADVEDAMEDVTNDVVSEAGIVIYESITVRCPASRRAPSPPPSDGRAREGLRVVRRSDYRALNLGTH